MRKILLLTLPIALLFLVSCGSEPSSSGDAQTDETDTTDVNLSEEEVLESYSDRDCPMTGNVLQGNKLVLPEKKLIAYISADSSTEDEQFGDSHRVLTIYNSDNCDQLDRKVLPVNNSPDFPYYLARINYNNTSNLLGIRGFYQVFCYDLEAKKLLPALKPEYKGERYGVDAQSGMIQRVEVWEHYLMGYARDEGAFAFDLSDPASPKNVLPFAEYEIDETHFGSLFLFPSSNGGTQCLLPKYDVTNDEFSINPLLDKPGEIETNVPSAARDNRFLVLRLKDGNNTPLAFDLEHYKKVDLPDDIAGKSTQEILKWMREN